MSESRDIIDIIPRDIWEYMSEFFDNSTDLYNLYKVMMTKSNFKHPNIMTKHGRHLKEIDRIRKTTIDVIEIKNAHRFDVYNLQNEKGEIVILCAYTCKKAGLNAGENFQFSKNDYRSFIVCLMHRYQDLSNYNCDLFTRHNGIRIHGIKLIEETIRIIEEENGFKIPTSEILMIFPSIKDHLEYFSIDSESKDRVIVWSKFNFLSAFNDGNSILIDKSTNNNPNGDYQVIIQDSADHRLCTTNLTSRQFLFFLDIIDEKSRENPAPRFKIWHRDEETMLMTNRYLSILREKSL